MECGKGRARLNCLVSGLTVTPLSRTAGFRIHRGQERPTRHLSLQLRARRSTGAGATARQTRLRLLCRRAERMVWKARPMPVLRVPSRRAPVHAVFRVAVPETPAGRAFRAHPLSRISRGCSAQRRTRRRRTSQIVESLDGMIDEGTNFRRQIAQAGKHRIHGRRRRTPLRQDTRQMQSLG